MGTGQDLGYELRDFVGNGIYRLASSQESLGRLKRAGTGTIEQWLSNGRSICTQRPLTLTV